MRFRKLAASAAALTVLFTGQPAADAVPLPSADSFYSYSGSTPLRAIATGTVLKSRPVDLHLAGLDTALFKGRQLLYRTTNQLGAPAVTVATVIMPITPIFPSPRLISYQTAYDALDGKCSPSYTISGGVSVGGGVTTGETPIIVGFLLQGYTVVTPDYEGTDLAWTAGYGEGQATLDGIQAALNSPDTGLTPTTKVAMMGYSGGAIATEWAAELAPKYAPTLDKQLVGSAIGGVFVNPAHNLKYVDGTPLWSGVMPGALVGLSRAFGLDLKSYANDYGKTVIDYVQDKCITDLLGHYPGLTFAKLTKPQYAEFDKVPAFVKLANKLIMSTGGTPTQPLLIGQGSVESAALAEGSPGDKPGIGPGDGVMIAGDVRSLARTYCQRGVPVDYHEYTDLDHISALAAYATAAVPWINARFTDAAPPSSCGTIAAGNSLAPLPMPKTTPNGSTPSTGRPTSEVPSGTSRPIAAGGGTNSDGVANTGTATPYLLTWAWLLLVLGAAFLWYGRRPLLAAALPRPSPRPRPPPPVP